MKNNARLVVDKMFSAFADGDIETFLETVSKDTVWIYHGTQFIPNAVFEGVDGVRKFITDILTKTEIISFEPIKHIYEGDTVVVLGKEHQKIKKSGKELKQKWVQIYTVKNALITRMEEFAISELVN